MKQKSFDGYNKSEYACL